MPEENIVKRTKALRQERTELVTESEHILALGASADGGLTDEQKTRDDEIHARLDMVDGDLGRFNRLMKADREAPADVGEARAVEAANGDLWCGFRDGAEFALVVQQACRPGAVLDPRLAAMHGVPTIGAAPANYMQESGGSAQEGYQVPPAMRQSIWELVFNGEDMLGMIDPEPTNSNAVDLLADESTPWGATGVTASWRGETPQMTASKLSTAERSTRMHDLYAFVIATDDLLQDAPRLNDRLTRKASAAIRHKASDAIVNGTGAGQPLGWKNANYAGFISQAKESGQAADTVVAGNVAKMYARQLRLSDARWVCNQDVLPQLFQMTLGDNSIFVPPATGFQQAPGGFLLGRPVVPIEHMETVGDAEDLGFISPSGYHAIGKSNGMQFASSMHLFFDYAMTAFRWTFRIGGQPFLSAAVSPQKGSTTRSHFITLAARA